VEDHQQEDVLKVFASSTDDYEESDLQEDKVRIERQNLPASVDAGGHKAKALLEPRPGCLSGKDSRQKDPEPVHQPWILHWENSFWAENKYCSRLQKEENSEGDRDVADEVALGLCGDAEDAVEEPEGDVDKAQEAGFSGELFHRTRHTDQPNLQGQVATWRLS